MTEQLRPSDILEPLRNADCYTESSFTNYYTAAPGGWMHNLCLQIRTEM